MATCLLLKPQVPEDDKDGRLNQIDDIRALARAIRTADLEMPDGGSEGITVNDIRTELIDRVYEADVVVVDVNRYGREPLPPSAALYYLIALSHAWGNKTILVARSRDFIPSALQMRHTLVLSNDFVTFLDAFEQAVKEIGEASDKPDNPVQEYLARQYDRQRAEEAERLKIELANREEQLRRMQAGTSEDKITFRPVSSPLQGS